MNKSLRTERLTLRRLQSGDAPALHAFFSDPVAMRYFHVPHIDRAQTDAWVKGTLAAPDDRCREYAIILDRTVIGKAGIWSAPELGFFLARPYWGRGLMTEALTALIPHLFATMALPELTADVDPRNTASLTLLDRLGFEETRRAKATIQIGDEWCDSVYLRLKNPAQVSA